MCRGVCVYTDIRTNTHIDQQRKNGQANGTKC